MSAAVCRAIRATAFELRAEEAPVAEVFEQVRGLGLTYASVGRMLKSTAYLGEVVFGELVNRSAHPPVVDAATWQRAQRAKATPGRKAKSERLLARLGVLRCASCGGRMSATTATTGKYNDRRRAIYRCGGHVGDSCPQRATIGAVLVEEYVARAFLAGVADMTAHGTPVPDDVGMLAETAQKAQAALDGAIKAFTGMETEAAAVERLQELRSDRDAAQEALEQARDREAMPTLSLRLVDEWPALTVDEKRRLLQAGLERVEVRPGRLPVEE
jgi:Recombinase zinc beta ribbon domain